MRRILFGKKAKAQVFRWSWAMQEKGPKLRPQEIELYIPLKNLIEDEVIEGEREAASEFARLA